MLDIETMGTSANAAIIAIGAVFFDLEEMGDTFYTKIDLQSCLDLGFDIEASTIEWWVGQSDQAKDVLSPSGRTELQTALDLFAKFLSKASSSAIIWGNGPAFDNAILSNAYRKIGVEKPWSYRDDRCVRTIRAIGDLYGVSYQNFSGTQHNALDDAIYQVSIICQVFKSLRLPF